MGYKLKWEEYNPNIGASTWLLKILPISAREGNPGGQRLYDTVSR